MVCVNVSTDSLNAGDRGIRCNSAVIGSLREWLDTEQPWHPPKSPIGEAINHTLGQWDALTLFLTDEHLPVDNHASERALRVAAKP